eukprot:XP_011447581.1 PREDICTED: uncharacterized protein LOC105342357 [Crassostrea gigas]
MVSGRRARICKWSADSERTSQRGRWCGKNSEYAEGIHVSKRATAIPYHIRPLSIAGIELGSQREYVREVFSESTMQKRMYVTKIENRKMAVSPGYFTTKHIDR